MTTTRWQFPEHLSSTDSFVIAERHLIGDRARRPKSAEPANGHTQSNGSAEPVAVDHGAGSREPQVNADNDR